MSVKATVFIPTYNGERYIGEILSTLLRQKVDFTYDILIIDSGSKDKTLDIIKSFQKKSKAIILKQIPNTEYGHGKTRDQGVRLAKGEIVVVLSHDATPSHDEWLYEMVKPFDINPQIVGVMGKQLPRQHCIPLLKYEINSVFNNFGPDFGTSVFYKDSFVRDQGTYDAISFYSDVNSACRRSALLGDLSYRDVPYAEDQLLGRDIIDAGLYKAYAPRGSVVHSNDLTLKEYASRLFDETMGLRKIGIPVEIPRRKLVVKLILRGVLKDSVRIVRDKSYGIKRKAYWLVINPLFHIEKWRGIRMGASTPLDDTFLINKYSFEKRKIS